MDKFNSFDDVIKKEITKKCQIQDVRIKNPNNPANLLNAILIEYTFKI